MVVAIFGIGLIGGSVAKDLRAANFCTEIIGVGRSEASNETALKLGLVDKIVTREAAIKLADLIILTVPVNSLINELKFVLDNIQSHQTVTDMGSTKGIVIDAIQHHPLRNRYVASHPMAGTENSGPNAAINNLFKDKICIICDKENSASDAVEQVESMYNTLGMRIKYMEAHQHDMHAAYVSHISHISSFVLAATVLEKEKDEEAILEMAGGGFESTVRLAKSSPEMWAPIFHQNKLYLLEVMDTYIEKMYHFRNLINKNKNEELLALMKEANEIRKILK
ncbi:MAG TPA: prephenate dehydrogenase [Chitinophagales bacterium]|jgi:prephenate dehydrogenase|nr:prephenate dehydrogenase [Chitinophagales bacterium]MBP6154602.1 prephenate dehydrogenase [Chitinophagales bacterium]HQV77273.1 prephenate dehydrogenase [Chitinophagales bacterium]HQW78334.1 prephenate dehydrogenase [Chitinophagales bacterium]HRB19092.1 prephenate dehydrogenase [Chitinophagales bacterium]